MESWHYKEAADQHLRPVQRARSVRREQGLIGATTCALRWGLVRSYLQWAHQLKIEGREHIPDNPPFILVGNHASHLDALIIASALPISLNHQVFPIAAGDTFFRYKTTAMLSSLFLNVLPMARDGSGGGSLLQLRERLSEGDCGFILFPEGTRSRTGTMKRFKAGVGMLTAGTNTQVIPCHLSGTFNAWPPTHRLPRPGKVRLRIGEPLLFPDVEHHRAGWKTIADKLETAVRRLAEQT